MGWITDIVEGIIKGFHSIFKKRNKVNGWEKLHKNKVPNWVERAGHRFYNKHPVKHHDLRINIKGKTYLYRIYFKKAAYGRVIEEYYRKKKRIVD